MPEFQNTIEIAFMDISEKNLDIVYKLVERDLKVNGLTNKITATTDRREAIKGAKYILNLARIGGAEAFHPDVEIPYRYGVDQCVGDTLCAGGIMYGQRGIAAVLDFCKDVRELAAPDALFLNYGNPNAMLTWAINKYGGVKCLGLCHGVQGGAHLIRVALGIDELDYICAGINHQTWYIQLKHKGRDITADELLAGLQAHEVHHQVEMVRMDMLKRFG
jgi:alpha-galactosidase